MAGEGGTRGNAFRPRLGVLVAAAPFRSLGASIVRPSLVLVVLQGITEPPVELAEGERCVLLARQYQQWIGVLVRAALGARATEYPDSRRGCARCPCSSPRSRRPRHAGRRAPPEESSRVQGEEMPRRDRRLRPPSPASEPRCARGPPAPRPQGGSSLGLSRHADPLAIREGETVTRKLEAPECGVDAHLVED